MRIDMRLKFERSQPVLLLAFQLLACWPVWRWMARRAVDGSDDGWGWLALITLVWLTLRDKPVSKSISPSLSLPSLLLLCYSLGYPFATPLVRALFAVAALGATASAYLYECGGLSIGRWGLLALSLPLTASLQFYLGYPLRALTATLTASLLRLNGMAVAREGAELQWGGGLVSVDAPCSGVKMLWAGLFLSFTLSVYDHLGARATVAAALFAFVAVIVGNALRATALFQIEVGTMAFPAWAHSGVGATIFLLTALAIAWTTRRLTGLEGARA